MTQTKLRFLEINLKIKDLKIPVCCIDGHVQVDMRSVCRFLRMAWSDFEQHLMTADSAWLVSNVDTTLLLPASQLVDWLQQPHGHAESRRYAPTRSNLADMWAYEFPRQVMHLFPDSSDARSHAAKLARAVRTGQAVTDPELAAGIKKTFLTLRQNRKPVVRTPETFNARAKGLIRVHDITPELVAQVYQRFQQAGFKGVAEHFTLTQNALNQMISGKFSRPAPELLAAHAKTFGAQARI